MDMRPLFWFNDLIPKMKEIFGEDNLESVYAEFLDIATSSGNPYFGWTKPFEGQGSHSAFLPPCGVGLELTC
jgi:hypothetical protein